MGFMRFYEHAQIQIQRETTYLLQETTEWEIYIKPYVMYDAPVTMYGEEILVILGTQGGN